MIGRQLLHYKVVEKLGAGGMGEVYRAHDSRLGRDVALKVLLQEKGMDPGSRKRLQREAMAVAALKHPNIVTIYSVEEHEHLLFLTMELVEGKSLDGLIPPEGLSLQQVLDIALPVTDAIRHAHEKGITHRDLKPGNIMLDEGERPKVLDFGLAKLARTQAEDGLSVSADDSVTREGAVLGTASYMSPEQALGKPTDSRSDIFSMGIILFEMATGRKPFQGDTPISTIMAILKDTPSPVTELNRSLPDHLARIVDRCLAKDPGQRYQSGLDLRTDLEGLREETSGSTPPAPVPASATSAASTAPPGPAPSTASAATPAPATTPASAATPAPATSATSAAGSAGPPRFALAGIIVLLALLAAGVWQPWKLPGRGAAGRNPGTSAENGSVHRLMAVVFPFENLGPAEDAYFAAGMAEEIMVRLSAVSSMGVISRTSAMQYDRTGKTMKQIRKDLGVDYVLEGTVRWVKDGEGTGQVRITPQLIRTADDVNVWSTIYERNMDDLFQVQSEIAGNVVQKLGVTLAGGEQDQLSRQPTESIEAYQAYLRAEDFSVPDWSALDADKVALLDTAVRLDPKFLRAWMALTRHHADQYRVVDRTEERLTRARAALHGAEAIDPDHPLTRLARGYYYYYGFGDYDRALAEFTAAAQGMPNDPAALTSMAWILRRQGKILESTEILERSLPLDPRNVGVIVNAAATYGALRRFDTAGELCDRAIALKPEDDAIRKHAFDNSLSAAGDLAAARRFLNPAPGDQPLMHAISILRLHTLERDWPGVLENLDLIPETSPFSLILRSYFSGTARQNLDQAAAARKSLEEGARLCREGLAQSPGNVIYIQFLSEFYAYLGRGEEAIQEAKQATDVTSRDLFAGPQQLENLARVYGIAGRHDEAFALLDRLLGLRYAEPLTVHWLRLDPRWDPLRGDPRFRELLVRHGDKAS